MLGRPGICEPVCWNVIAGSWLIASVCNERMMHISSASLAVCGKSSLIHDPDSPCWLNLKMLGATGNEACAELIVVLRSSG